MMRTYKMYTGSAGMERIDDAIREELETRNILDYLDFLVEKTKLTSEEADSLENMINSPDKSNRVVAVEILKNRYDYGNIISTPGT
jgi:hypothetical protein